MTSIDDELFWVNCNKCAVGLFGVKDGVHVKMFVTNCGCIFCSNCASISTKPQCAACGCNTVKLLPIGKNLPPHALEMFNQNMTSLSKMNKRKSFQDVQVDRSVKIMKRRTKEAGDQFNKEDMLEKKRHAELEKLDRKVEEKRRALADLDKANRKMEEESARSPRPREGRSGQKSSKDRGMSRTGTSGYSSYQGSGGRVRGMYPAGSVISPPVQRNSGDHQFIRPRSKQISSVGKNWKSGPVESFLF